MKILGGLGVTVLECNLNNGCHKKKKVILISDAHADIPYCTNNKTKISDWIKNKMNKGYQILLEEVERKGVSLQELWPDAKHTQELKKLYLNNSFDIIPVDIRPHLILFSWQILNSTNINEVKYKNKYEKIQFKTFLKRINDFFDEKSEFYNNSIKHLIKNKIKKNSGLGEHFRNLKYNFENYKRNNILLMDKMMSEIIKNNQDVLLKFDKLINQLMEWYIILKLFSSEKDTIIHTGLFHSREILNYLVNRYNFNIIYKDGINTTIKENMENCFTLPNNILNPEIVEIEKICNIL
jgi:hypothetical protein